MEREGAIFDVVVAPNSRLPLRFSAKMTKIVEGKLVETEVEGDYEGTMTWTFEPTDGKTKVTVRWNVQPKRLLRFLSYFVDLRKGARVGSSTSILVLRKR
jgi:hypothetical protein